MELLDGGCRTGFITSCYFLFRMINLHRDDDVDDEASQMNKYSDVKETGEMEQCIDEPTTR